MSRIRSLASDRTWFSFVVLLLLLGLTSVGIWRYRSAGSPLTAPRVGSEPTDHPSSPTGRQEPEQSSRRDARSVEEPQGPPLTPEALALDLIPCSLDVPAGTPDPLWGFVMWSPTVKSKGIEVRSGQFWLYSELEAPIWLELDGYLRTEVELRDGRCLAEPLERGQGVAGRVDNCDLRWALVMGCGGFTRADKNGEFELQTGLPCEVFVRTRGQEGFVDGGHQLLSEASQDLVLPCPDVTPLDSGRQPDLDGG